MKLLYKDTIGFSFLIFIAIICGLFLNDTQLKINAIHENSDMLNDEQQKLIQRHTIEFTLVIFGMIVFMICIIVMIMTFSRNPMLSNIRNIKNATAKISKGDFSSRISIVGSADEVSDLCEDINEMAKKLFELQEKLLIAERFSSIGELSARLAHDIKNPLSIMMVALANIKIKYKIDVEDANEFERLERSIFRISHQIDDVLDYVKKREMVTKVTKFSEIIQESLDSIIVPDNIKIILPKNDVKLLCDKKQFSIVLNNLIINGIQAIDDTGTVEISIEENEDETIIQVKDSGNGIPKDEIYKIFDPLFTTKQTGTGLGLASVKTIIESHDGTISVVSPPVIFTIRMPKISKIKLT